MFYVYLTMAIGTGIAVAVLIIGGHYIISTPWLAITLVLTVAAKIQRNLDREDPS